MKSHTLKIILFLMLLNAWSFCGEKSLKAVKVNQAPSVDGFLNDEIWKSAIPFMDFKTFEPKPNGEPSEKTEVRIIYDNNNLYIGIYCYDKEVEKVSANSMSHDVSSNSDDQIRVLLDPFQDKRTAYIFFVNPNGAKSEGLAFGQDFNLNWDGIWNAKSQILDNGWSVEIEIPFKTISFNPNLSAWGINIQRYIPRKLETIRLSGTNRNSFFYNPKEAALLEGIENIEQGIGLTIKPYINTNVYSNFQKDDKYKWDATGGFDVYKSFTPNFIGAISYNTDFAETEVDDRRLNLTRFPLYYPEKRAFFLEGSEIFDFGTGLGSFVPFFSRKIGIYNGELVPLLLGTKIFGKIGNTNLAVLDVQTKKSNNINEKNFLAGRIYQNIFDQSKVGIIFTNGNSLNENKNTFLGLDFIYSTSRFMDNNNFSAGAWWIYNWNSYKEGEHQGYGIKIDYPNDLWDISLTYRRFGDSLDPGLGFLPRKNNHYLGSYIAYQPRPEKGIIGDLVRQFFFELEGECYWDLKGNLETYEIFTAPINLRTQSGEHIEFNVIQDKDILPYDFEVARDVTIPAGPYNYTNYRFEFNSALFRPLVLDFSYRFGEFYSGIYNNIETGITLKYKGYATLSLSGNFVYGNLPQGKFNENVYQIKTDFYFSPDIGLLNFIQYDDESKEIGFNIRFRWQISPGNDIYLVYNRNWKKEYDPKTRFEPLEEKGIIKFQISYRP